MKKIIIHKNSLISISIFALIFSFGFSLPSIYKENTKNKSVEKSVQTTGTENWGSGQSIEFTASSTDDINFKCIVPYAFGYEGAKTVYSSITASSVFGHDSFLNLNYNDKDSSQGENDKHGTIVGGIDYYNSNSQYEDSNDFDGISTYKISEFGPGFNLATKTYISEFTIFTLRFPNYVKELSLNSMEFDYYDNYYSEFYFTISNDSVKHFTFTESKNKISYNDLWEQNFSTPRYKYNYLLLTNGANPETSNREFVLKTDFTNASGGSNFHNNDIISLNSIYLDVGINFNDIYFSNFVTDFNESNVEITVFNENTAQAVYTLTDPIVWNGRGDELATNDYDDNGLILTDQQNNVYPFTINGNQITITGLTPGTTYNMKFMQYENPMNLLNEPNNVSFYEMIPGTSEFVIQVEPYDTGDPFGGITGSSFGIEMVDQTSVTFQLQSTNGLTFQSGDQIILSDDTNGLNYTITFNDPLDYTDVTLSSPNISWSYSGGPTNPEMSITVSGLNPNSSYKFDIETHAGINDIVKINTYSFYTDYEDIDNTASTPISASTTSTTESSISGTYIIDLKGRNYDDYSNLVLLDQANNEIIFPNDKFTLTNPTTNTYNYEITNLNSNYQVTQISLTYRENRDESITDSSIYTQTINISLDNDAYTIFERPTLEYSQIDFSSTSSIYEAYFEIKDYGSFGKSLDIQGEIITKIDLFENIRFEKYQDDVWTEIDLTGSEVITINYDVNFGNYYISFDRNQLGLEVEQIRVFLPYYDRSIVNGEFNYDYSNPDYVFNFTSTADINSEKTTVIYDETNNVAKINLNGNLHGNIHSEDFFLTYTVFDGVNIEGQTYTDTYRESDNIFIETEKQDDSTIDYIYYIYDLPSAKTIQIQEYGFKTPGETIIYNEFSGSSTFYTRYRGLENVTENEVKLVTNSATSFSFKIILTDQQLETSDFDGTQIRIRDGKGNEYYPINESVTFEVIKESNGTIFYYTVNDLNSNTNYGDIYIDIATEYGTPAKQNDQYIYGYSFNIGNVTTLELGQNSFDSWNLVFILIVIFIIFLILLLFLVLYYYKKSAHMKSEYKNIFELENIS